MQKIVAVAIAALAVLVIFLAARSAGRRTRAGGPRPIRARRRAEGSARAGGERLVGGELVAVIAAAVSAASGMAPGTFRIAGISPSAASAAKVGFNTPVWGHVDRFKRGEGL
jgi:uncharacterized MAPEG superfamily protein